MWGIDNRDLGRRTSGRVVPLEAVRELHAERNALLRELERARHQLAALAERSREAEGALRARDEARAELSRVRQEAERAARELRQARHEAEQVQARLDALEAELRQVRAAEPVAPAAPDAEEGRVARLSADLANLRRHRDEQIAAARRDERIARLQDLAELHDNLVRSLEANPDPSSPYYQGNEGILAQVRGALAGAGARPVGEAGDRFDPQLHEAIGTVHDPARAGTLLAVQRAGFVLEDGGLVRPALVVVAT